jgi:hypothetical protein
VTQTTVRPASRREFWSEILAALTLLFAVVGMAVSSPPLVGPDEAAHQATAYYTSVYILPPVEETVAYTPGILKHGACTAFNSEQDVSCFIERTPENILPGKVRVFNYPPPYYWVVGLGQKFAPEADTWMDVGGRIASLLLNLSALTLLLVVMSRHIRSWGTYLLAVSTPMAAFLWAVVNANGWEISSGMVFAYFFARAWWNSDEPLGRWSRQWVTLTLTALSSLVFGLSRHDALVWLTLILLAIVLMGKTTLTRSQQAMTAGVGMLGIFAGIIWQFTHPAVHMLNNDKPVANPGAGDYVRWFNEVDEVLPDRLLQMVGNLGWLDTPSPQWMLIILLVSWSAVIGFLFARTKIPASVLIVGFLGTILVPSIMETLRWNDWPYWWQGRITLSFTIPFLFVFLLRYGHHARRPIVLLSMVNAFVLAYMVWQNTMRYAFGVKDYLPMRWTDPALGSPWFALALILVGLMLVFTGIRAWIFARESRAESSKPLMDTA